MIFETEKELERKTLAHSFAYAFSKIYQHGRVAVEQFTSKEKPNERDIVLNNNLIYKTLLYDTSRGIF